MRALVLAAVLAACTPQPAGPPPREITISGAGWCRAVELGDGWYVSAWHCYLARGRLAYVRAVGDAMLLRDPEWSGLLPRHRLRCEPRPPGRALWRGRVASVSGTRIDLSSEAGDSGSPVFDEQGRVWGVVSLVGPTTVVAPVWPFCEEERR